MPKRLIVIGSEGNIGRRLMAAYPDALGIDIAPGAEIQADLATIDYDAPTIRAALENASGLIHLATSANTEAPDAVHFAAVTNAARLVAACARVPVPRLVLASSDWAAPKVAWAQINTYGHSKRVLESLAAMYQHATGCRATGLRFGWVPSDPSSLIGAEQWLLDNYWDDARLVSEVEAALGPFA